MKRILIGMILGALIAFPLGVNVGKKKPLFSNPFAEKAISEQVRDTAERVMEDTSDKVKKTADQVLEDARQAIHRATEPEQE
jgi:hypothetical protein